MGDKGGCPWGCTMEWWAETSVVQVVCMAECTQHAAAASSGSRAAARVLPPQQMAENKLFKLSNILLQTF